MKKVKSIIMGSLAVAMVALFLAMPCLTARAIEYGQTTTNRVRVRASSSTDADIVVVIETPSRVQIDESVTGADGKTWYKVLYDGQSGYIRSDLVQKGWTLYINKDAVRIRGGAGTTYNIVATVSSGIKFNVSAQQNDADGKVWYYGSLTHEGQTVQGFVRSDMLSETKPATTPVTTTIPGTQKVTPSPSPSVEVTTEPEPSEEPEVVPEPSTAPTTAPSKEPVPEATPAPKITIMDPVGEPYVPEGFEEKMVSTGNEQFIKAWQYGQFFLVYASEDGGQTAGWYMYDSVTRNYQKYVYADKPAGHQVVGKSSGGKTVAIVILIALLVIAIVAAALLWLRMQSYREMLEDTDGDEEEEKPRTKREKEEEPLLRRSEPVHASVRTGTPRDLLESGSVSHEPVRRAPQEKPASIRNRSELAPTISVAEKEPTSPARETDPDLLREELRAAEAVRAYEEAKAAREPYRSGFSFATTREETESVSAPETPSPAEILAAAEASRAQEDEMARITATAREVEREYQERRASVSEELKPEDFEPISVKAEDRYVEEAPLEEITFNLDGDDAASSDATSSDAPKSVPIDTDDDFEILDI